MAESEGFEPSIRFPVYTLSRGAPSATRPALPILCCCLFLHTRTLIHGARARYSGRPALHPSGSLRSCKIAPGDFVSHSASSPKFKLLSCNEHHAHLNMAHVRITAGVLPFALRAIRKQRGCSKSLPAILPATRPALRDSVYRQIMCLGCRKNTHHLFAMSFLISGRSRTMFQICINWIWPKLRTLLIFQSTCPWQAQNITSYTLILTSFQYT